jgi:hypothetical protein
VQLWGVARPQLSSFSTQAQPPVPTTGHKPAHRHRVRGPERRASSTNAKTQTPADATGSAHRPRSLTSLVRRPPPPFPSLASACAYPFSAASSAAVISSSSAVAPADAVFR